MYIGMDIHKKFIQIVYIENASGPVKESFKIAATYDSITEYAKRLKPEDNVVLESTIQTVPVVDLLKKSGANVVISNPMRTKMIADSKIKSDKVDAEALARLLACGYIPPVWQPTEEIGKLRAIVSTASSLINHRIIIKNRIHSILQRNLVDYNKIPELFNGTGRKFLEEVILPEEEKFQMDLEIQLLDEVEKRIKIITKIIACRVIKDEEAKRIMSIPGIDFYTALALKSAIGDISRFDNPKKLVSYFGLNPRIYQSANSCFGGPISKRGRSYARWVIVQAAKHAARTPGPLRAFFKRIKRRSVNNKAVVAVANKVTRIIWHMLTKKTEYRCAHPLRTKEKMDRLRIIATGVRLKTGMKAGVYKGGRPAYLEARKHDHDNAKKLEKEYMKSVRKRIDPSKSK